MSDFEKWFKSLNKNGRVTYFLGQEGRISEEAWNHQQAIIDEHTEVIKLQDADLRKYEKQIESLKEQLNSMEACYIGKKKELEELQKTNISLEAGLRKNSKNKQKLLGKNIELQKRIDEVLEYLDGESANRWGLWKEKADMLDQGASNAFEEAYWMVKKALRGASD